MLMAIWSSTQAKKQGPLPTFLMTTINCTTQWHTCHFKHQAKLTAFLSPLLQSKLLKTRQTAFEPGISKKTRKLHGEKNPSESLKIENEEGIH